MIGRAQEEPIGREGKDYCSNHETVEYMTVEVPIFFAGPTFPWIFSSQYNLTFRKKISRFGISLEKSESPSMVLFYKQTSNLFCKQTRSTNEI